MDAFCHRYTHNNGFSVVLIIFCTAQVFLLSKVIMEILYKTTCNIKYVASGASGVLNQVPTPYPLWANIPNKKMWNQ